MRLVNGRKIWAAMWEYRHPDVDCFTSQVNGKRAYARPSRVKILENKKVLGLLEYFLIK